MNYQNLSQTIDRIAPALLAMSDNIFDHPEEGLQEYYAVEQLTGWLEQEGFHVERGVADVETSAPSGVMEWEAPISDFCANMMPCPVSGMPADTICRGRVSWPQPRP